MNIQKFRETIKKRASINDEYSYGVEQCWNEEIRLLTEDIQSTIQYLSAECTSDEYSWISEIIDDIAEITGSRELIDCYKALSVKYPEECIKYNIAESIQFAEEALGDKNK